MRNNKIQNWINSSFLFAINQSYIEELYHKYLVKPHSMNQDWSYIFEKLSIQNSKKMKFNFIQQRPLNSIKKFTNCQILNFKKQINIQEIKLMTLINSFREHGHKIANINPIQLTKKKNIDELNLEFYHFTESDYDTYFDISNYFDCKNKKMKIREIYNLLKKIYCSSVGSEYMYISSEQEKSWIQKEIESKIFSMKKLFTKEERIDFFSDLIFAKELENYLKSRFPGAKRFSLEGGDALIPMLKDLIKYASKKNIHEIFLGMAHRGRLNVLINVFGKNPKELFNEFSENFDHYKISGDVKYHQGFSSTLRFKNEKSIDITLFYNPSHLEIINPVIMGSTRARQDQIKNKKQNNTILPITIHGDASVIGQGVTQETLNMSQTRGYQVGGTIRIIINNQIGFTTSNPKDSRSTQYCTDIMKMIEAPIFHVNCDDPESVVFISRLALNFRNKFKRDVVIDLVCYRRHGHNEVDEPSITQPIMYQKIKKCFTIQEIYLKKLKKEKIVSSNYTKSISKLYRESLEHKTSVLNNAFQKKNDDSILNLNLQADISNKTNLIKKVQKQKLQSLAKHLNIIPKNITIQERVKKIYQERVNMALEKQPFDWGGAETLAYATLLDQGISIRLSGEDVRRGTFAHRHATIHDQVTGITYTPLKNIKKEQGNFFIWDSVLSEEAVLAFEYGYSLISPKVLTIWEAQFGDFSNVAQVVIDQFISSGEQKWGKQCSLVIFLPHGYEGQGPEHSSARIERYLQLCAEENIKICIPSTPSQIYHILRHQILLRIRKPLIIITPKSLLRNRLATSNLEELLKGRFQKVIPEVDKLNLQKVKRVIFCSGKIYYDLLKKRRENHQTNISIIRVEQLYPFPRTELQKIINTYKNTQDFVWCQEEPLNHGAWSCSQYQNNIQSLIPKNSLLSYIGRNESASPAIGYASIHQKQQNFLINKALTI